MEDKNRQKEKKEKWNNRKKSSSPPILTEEPEGKYNDYKMVWENGKTETVLNVMILLSGVTMPANCQLYNPNMGRQLYNETDRHIYQVTDS